MKGLLKLMLLISFPFLSTDSLAQENILRLSANKQYQIYFVWVRHHGEPDSVSNKITITWEKNRSFQINDEKSIEQLEQWKGQRSQTVHFCWYDYFVYVINENKIIDEFRVNEECKEVISKYGAYSYSSSPISQLNQEKKIIVADIRFDSLATGRAFVAEARKIKELCMPELEHNEWYEFDGNLTISTKSKGFDGKIEAGLTNKIHKDYSTEKLKIVHAGGGRDYTLSDVYCNSSLGKSLKGFKISSPWRPIDSGYARLISITDIQIRELVEKYARQQ